MSYFDDALKAAGGPILVAGAIKVSPQRLNNWRSRGVPEDYCAPLENAFPEHFRCERLRSDLQWERDDKGRVVAYRVPVAKPKRSAQQARAA